MTDEKKNVKEEKQRLTDEEMDNVVGGGDLIDEFYRENPSGELFENK